MTKNIKKISFSAMMVALAMALSKVKIIPMPFGGSVTLFSMFAIALPGYFFGLKYGLISSFLMSIMKLFFGGYVYTPVQAMCDYIFSYTSFAVSGFFHKNNTLKGMITAYMLGVILRFIFTSISGYVFFADYTPDNWNPLVYAIVYNGAYIFAEALLTMVVLFIPYINRMILELKYKLCS